MGHQLLLTFFISLLVSLSHGVEYRTLYSICSQTQNEEICVRILERDSRTNSATLPELSLISINLTREQANKNYKAFTGLRDNSSTEALKIVYNKCVVLYRLMFQKLNMAYNLSKQRQYSNIHQLGEAQDLVYSCENGLPSNSPTAAISEDMILTCEASASVTLYIASSAPNLYENPNHT